jgi:hypothetical protein
MAATPTVEKKRTRTGAVGVRSEHAAVATARTITPSTARR